MFRQLSTRKFWALAPPAIATMKRNRAERSPGPADHVDPADLDAAIEDLDELAPSTRPAAATLQNPVGKLLRGSLNGPAHSQSMRQRTLRRDSRWNPLESLSISVEGTRSSRAHVVVTSRSPPE